MFGNAKPARVFVGQSSDGNASLGIEFGQNLTTAAGGPIIFVAASAIRWALRRRTRTSIRPAFAPRTCSIAKTRGRRSRTPSLGRYPSSGDADHGALPSQPPPASCPGSDGHAARRTAHAGRPEDVGNHRRSLRGPAGNCPARAALIDAGAGRPGGRGESSGALLRRAACDPLKALERVGGSADQDRAAAEQRAAV